MTKGYETLGPAAKIRKPEETPLASAAVLTFLNTGDRLNLLRQVRDSISSVEAGVQRYGPLCDMLKIPYFAPKADTVRRRPAAFAPGRTFGMYFAHLAKPCHLLGFSFGWRDASARGDANGLAHAMELSLKFENYMNLKLLRRCITAQLEPSPLTSASSRTCRSCSFYWAHPRLCRPNEIH